jgi:hypothetical protein
VKNFRKTAVALKQTSFSSAEFAAKKRITRREQFLAEMEQTFTTPPALIFHKVIMAVLKHN